MDRRFLTYLKIDTPEHMLKDLVQAFESESDDREHAIVRITAGPHIFEGIPVKIETLQKEPWLALLNPEGGVRGNDALSFLPVRSISSVSVLNFRSQLGALAETEALTIDPDEAPSRLEVERSLKSLDDEKSVSIDWGDKNPDPAARFMAAKLATAAGTVLKEVSADSMGKKALKSVSAISFVYKPTHSLTVERNGKKLEICFGLKMNSKGLNQTLKSGLERNL